MLTVELARPIARRGAAYDRFREINSVAITGNQLTRAFHVPDALADSGLSALTAYAEQEGIIPIGLAAKALVLRMGLVGDFLDGPGIPDAEWDYLMEALARVRLVDDEEIVPIGATGIRFDGKQLKELLDFARELPW